MLAYPRAWSPLQQAITSPCNTMYLRSPFVPCSLYHNDPYSRVGYYGARSRLSSPTPSLCSRKKRKLIYELACTLCRCVFIHDPRVQGRQEAWLYAGSHMSSAYHSSDSAFFFPDIPRDPDSLVSYACVRKPHRHPYPIRSNSVMHCFFFFFLHPSLTAFFVFIVL